MRNIKRCFRSKSFWLLLQAGGVGVGVFSAILVLLQQMMCVKGYSTQYSGNCGAALVGSGLVVSLIVGTIVDNVEMLKGRLEEVVKVRHQIVTHYTS